MEPRTLKFRQARLRILGQYATRFLDRAAISFNPDFRLIGAAGFRRVADSLRNSGIKFDMTPFAADHDEICEYKA